MTTSASHEPSFGRRQLFEPATNETHVIDGSRPFLVGRSQTAALPLFDPACARQHFQLVERAEQIWLEPLSDRSPTLVNGRRASEPTRLVHGAVIQAGSTELIFLERDDPTLIRSPRGFPGGLSAEPGEAKSQRGAETSSRPPSPSQSVASQSVAPPSSVSALSSASASPSASPPALAQITPMKTAGEKAAAGATSRGAAPSPPRAAAQRDRTIIAEAGADDEVATLDEQIRLAGQMLIGRDAERATIVLSHPQVSRVHAQIVLHEKTASVSDLNSANGTFVNGVRIQQITTVKRGDRIEIGPYALVFDGQSLISQSRVNNIELAARNLTRTVADRKTGAPLKLLDDISLVIRPREFVCLLGPSGSGKSTLLSALSARVPADEGRVTINGEDLYAGFEALKRDIAVVPQKDVMHEFLDVRTAIGYTARLRLPPDTQSGEFDRAVADMLDTVGLVKQSETQIRHLSGGQVKRASLANEIVSKPSLLFLDEVTSGLDEQTDRDMMQLFRQIADGGKTVVCITHSLANVEEHCHRVVILTEGGKLAFAGSPAEARKYFGIAKLGDVYDKLRSLPAEEWQSRFRSHPSYRAQTVGRPRDSSEVSSGTASGEIRDRLTDRLWLGVRQTQLLALRHLRIQLADLRSLSMMAMQCLIVAGLVTLLFGDVSAKSSAAEAKDSASIMFLMTVSALWFGCSNSAKEIVKERTIYQRERDVNLIDAAYLAAKFLLLGTIGVVQVLVLFAIVRFGTGVDAGWKAATMIASLALTGVALGLLISSVSGSTDMAVTLVPLVLIPQIVLAGAIAALEGTVVKLLAQLCVTAYWGYGGLVASLPEPTVEALRYEDWSFFNAMLVVMLHAVVFLAAAWTTLMVVGQGEAVYRRALDKWLKQPRADDGGRR